jgi:hypothetical protein
MTEERMPPPDGAESPEASAPEAASAGVPDAPGDHTRSPADGAVDLAAAPGQRGGDGSVDKPLVEPASPDVDIVAASPVLPGSHRGGFFRLPTAPVAVTVQSAPTEPDGDLTPASAQWLAADEPQIHKGLAGWALAFAIIGLVVSLFVGWGFPIGLVAVISAVLALRRPLESRAVAVWAIVIGSVSILYSAGWLVYAAMRANLFG